MGEYFGMAESLRRLAGRLLDESFWRSACEEDKHQELGERCKAIPLPSQSGEFEVLMFKRSGGACYREAFSLPMRWEEAAEGNQHEEQVSEGLVRLEEDVRRALGLAKTSWRLRPRDWSFSRLPEECRGGLEWDSAFVPAAAALLMRTKYRELSVVPTVFATGCGNVDQDRLSHADGVKEKYAAATALLEMSKQGEAKPKLFTVGIGDEEVLKGNEAIRTALLPLVRAMAQEPVDSPESDADNAELNRPFDRFYQLLADARADGPRELFFQERILPRLRRRACHRDFFGRDQGRKALISVCSGNSEGPATVAVLAETDEVVFINNDPDDRKVKERITYVAESFSANVGREMKQRTEVTANQGIDGILETIGSVAAELRREGKVLYWDITTGNKLCTIAMDRIAESGDRLLYLEQKYESGSSGPRCPSGNQLVEIPPAMPTDQERQVRVSGSACSTGSSGRENISSQLLSEQA